MRASVGSNDLMSVQGDFQCAVSFQEDPAALLQHPEEVKKTARPWNVAQERHAQGDQTSQDIYIYPLAPRQWH